MKKIGAFLFFAIVQSFIVSCKDSHRLIDDFDGGAAKSSYAISGTSGALPATDPSPQDAGKDANIQECIHSYQSCYKTCFDFPSQSSERKNCLNNCLNDYRVCTGCPLGSSYKE